jgi:hypothetical protein
MSRSTARLMPAMRVRPCARAARHTHRRRRAGVSDGARTSKPPEAPDRLALLGFYGMMVGGLLAASGYVVSTPVGVDVAGAVLFLGGAVLIGIRSGLRNAWSAIWRLFP